MRSSEDPLFHFFIFFQPPIITLLLTDIILKNNSGYSPDADETSRFCLSLQGIFTFTPKASTCPPL